MTLVLSCTVFEIRRLIGKNCIFLLPFSHSVPSLPLSPLEFCGEVNHEETRVMGLSYREKHDRSLSFLTQCQRVTDGQTDRQTDGRIYYSDVNKDLGLKAKAKDPKYQGQIFHRSSPYSVHHFFIVNVVCVSMFGYYFTC